MGKAQKRKVGGEGRKGRVRNLGTRAEGHDRHP